MLTGNSIWHVNQDLGKCYSKDEIRGYYNNLTEKVVKAPELLFNDKLPQLDLAGKNFVDFPVAIFQYGLGAYDLYLQTEDEVYLNKFMQCVIWAINNQDELGRWNNFFYVYPDAPFGAMAQGEAASLLVRAFKQTGEDKYINAAKKAIDYMLKSEREGGTTIYREGEVILREYTHLATVLNGWIFAWWGLYDYVLATDDQGQYHQVMDRSVETLLKYLPKFKGSFWSLYDLDGKIASPFYHNLHIAQMQAMYDLTDKEPFYQYSLLWLKQQSNPVCKGFAFFWKAVQKILER